MTALRARLARREESVGSDQRPSVALALVGDKPTQVMPADIPDGSRHPGIGLHAADVEVFNDDGLVIADTGGGQCMQRLLSDGSDTMMEPSHRGTSPGVPLAALLAVTDV